MNAARLFAYFIIFIMVASTLAFVWEFYTQNNQGGENQPPPEIPPTPLTYKSTGEVDANVVEVFPTIAFSGRTNEMDIGKIDAEVQDANGIVRINGSNYRTPEQGSEFSLAYAAEVTYDDSKYSAEEIVEGISRSADGTLYGIEAAVMGLVILPKDIELSNADLNITKTHSLENQFSNAYLSTEGKKGDALKVVLNVRLSGEALIDIQAFESKNLTAEAVPLSLEGKYALSELDKRIVVYGDVNYSYLPEGTALKAELLDINGIENADVEIFPGMQRINLNIYDANASSKQNDLNSAFSSISGITNFFFVPVDENKLYAAIDFNDEQPFSNLRNEIINKISALGISESSIDLKEPSASLNIDINTASEQTAGVYAELKTLFEQKHISSNTYQTGKSSIGILTMPDTNASYTIDVNYLPLFAIPGHSVGEEISLEIDFYGKRSKAIAIRAVEQTAEES